MREALINCPLTDNDGNDVSHVREAAIKTLCDLFGGCTIIDARGVWKGKDQLYDEPTRGLVVACEPGDVSDGILRGVAHYIIREAKQEAVYVRYPSGDVEIVYPPRQEEAA